MTAHLQHHVDYDYGMSLVIYSTHSRTNWRAGHASLVQKGRLLRPL